MPAVWVPAFFLFFGDEMRIISKFKITDLSNFYMDLILS
jgi:hypothetical protein